MTGHCCQSSMIGQDSAITDLYALVTDNVYYHTLMCFRKTTALIIDEASMMSARLLDLMDRVLKAVRVSV